MKFIPLSRRQCLDEWSPFGKPLPLVKNLEGLKVPWWEVKTNARVKSYLYKDVLQVANDDIFATGNYERSDGHPKRMYDVPPPGQAADPARSLEESKRRAKAAVRDIALCNRFTHMFTWTLNGAELDRYDADAIYKRMRGFLSNATQRKNFRYVCIPEYHDLRDGEEKPAIHMHGLCVLGDVQIIPSLRSNGQVRLDEAGRQIFNMTDWKLGWSTCVKLDDNYEKAVNYITEYITKCETKIFGKWYLSSRSIRKKPDILPLERMDFYSFRDETRLEAGAQMEVTLYKDVRVVSEEYGREPKKLRGA